MRWFFVILMLSSITRAQTDLWQKAVAVMAHNQQWMAGTMVMEFELLDKNNEADLHNVTTYKNYLDDNGEIQSDLVRMLTNGKDVTEKERENLQKARDKERASNDESENSFAFSGDDEPFHPDNQDKLELTPLTETKEINDRTCQGFEYSLALEEHTKKGTVWLDVNTGAPVLQKFTTDPLPPKMKEMQTVTWYDYSKDDALTVSKIMFEGVAGVLFIKKKVRGTMTFDDYWLYDNVQQ